MKHAKQPELHKQYEHAERDTQQISMYVLGSGVYGGLLLEGAGDLAAVGDLTTAGDRSEGDLCGAGDFCWLGGDAGGEEILADTVCGSGICISLVLLREGRLRCLPDERGMTRGAGVASIYTGTAC